MSVHDLNPNREGITLVWFDRTLTEANALNLSFDHLRMLNDYILIYSEKTLYMDYLQSEEKRHNSVISILHDTENLDETHDCEQVQAILLISSSENDEDKKKIETTEKKYNKVIGIFEDQSSMFEKLQQIIVHVEHQLAQNMTNIFSSFNPKERSLKDVREELVSFMWSHVFKFLIKAMPSSPDAHQQMLDEYKLYYAGNTRQLQLIDDFERTYDPHQAIRWYTKSCFLFRVLNQTLRTENIEALYIFRSFIVDMCKSLEAIHTDTKIERLYRGGQMNRDEIEKYTVGTLVASNTFLSTSRSLRVARSFIGLDPITGKSASESREDQIQFVLFDINTTAGGSASDFICADISNQSVFSAEEEVLFDLGTIFEITEIDYDIKCHLWHIRMQPSTEIAHRKREYEDYIQQQLKETNPIVLFGILLFDMGEHEQSSKYLQRLLKQLPNDHEDRANVLYSIARIYRFTNQYEKALEYLNSAETFLRARLPQSSYDLARTLSGTASVYYEMKDYERELIYYQESMTIFQQILPANHIEIARSLNRLGFAYTNQKNYVNALENLNASLAIYNEIVPNEHPSPAQVLYNIGVVYDALGDIDQSLQYYQRALQLREKSLPNYHPYVAESCLAMSMVHKKHHQLDLALAFAQRALSIYEKKFSPEHKSIKDVQEMIESIQNEMTSQ